MDERRRAVRILVCDDDPDDRMLIEDSLKESRLANPRDYVADGEELMDYLLHRGRYAGPGGPPLPGLILLDLNMPRKDGREALQEIKANDALRRIPVVILTTSRSEQDILRSYDLGASGFVTKPVTFAALVDAMQVMAKYWFEIVELPPGTDARMALDDPQEEDEP